MRPRARPPALTLVRQKDSSTWIPDATIDIKFNPRSKITDHPVEDGITVTDHVQQQPEVIVATVIITENRIAPRQGGRLHLQEMVGWLRETKDAGDLVDLVTRRLGTFTGFAIGSLPHVVDKVSRLEIPIEFREVRIATSTTVLISVEEATSDVAVGAPDEVDTGEQSTTSTDGDAEAENSDQSLLSSLLGAL